RDTAGPPPPGHPPRTPVRAPSSSLSIVQAPANPPLIERLPTARGTVLQTTHGVPDPRAARSRGRRPRRAARPSPSPGAARIPAPARERAALERPADRRGLGPRPAEDRRGLVAELRLAAAQGDRRRRDRVAGARLRLARRSGALRPRAL